LADYELVSPRSKVAQVPDESEVLFSAYVRQRPDLTAEREVPWGTHTPDFTVTGRLGTVVCEVYSPTLILQNRVGTFDSITPVGNALTGRKRKQGRAVSEAGVPYAVVIGRANADLPFSEFELMVAMFGGKHKVGPQVNTRYSALAVVSRFNPTVWRYEAALAERTASGSQDLGDKIRVALELERELVADGLYDPDSAVSRLRVAHNPWAKAPLDAGWFGGPHDEQFVFDPNPPGGQLIRTTVGWRIDEVPGARSSWDVAQA
jgi:hypothetical protein